MKTDFDLAEAMWMMLIVIVFGIVLYLITSG